jgi:hypothetical protein
MIPVLKRLSTSSALLDPEHRHAMVAVPPEELCKADIENAFNKPRRRDRDRMES